MIDTLIALGMFGVLIFIAIKSAIINDVTHEMRDVLRDMLKGGFPPPPPSLG